MNRGFWSHSWRTDATEVEGARLDRALVRRVLGFARPYRRQLGWFLFVIVVIAIAEAIPWLLFRAILDRAIPQEDQGLVTVLALATVGVFLVRAAFALAERWLSARIGEGLIYDLRVALFDHVQRMPIAFFTRTQTGSLVSRMNTDVVGAQRALTNTLGTVASNAISVAVTLTIMFALEWRLTLATLVVVPGFVLAARRIGTHLATSTREQMEHNAAMSNRMTERFNVAGALVMALFGDHDREVDEFSGRAGAVRDAGIRLAMYMRALMLVLGLVAAIGTATVYWLGARFVISGALTVGTVVAFAGYVSQLYQPLTQLTNARVEILTAFVAFDRVFEVLDFPHGVADRDGAATLTSPRGEVRFDHVSFRYPGRGESTLPSLEEGVLETAETTAERVLRDVSFTAAPGEMVALVGPSGAGKSTIVSLVPRLYDVTDGVVRVDGHDVRDLTLESLRSSIGVVSQDPHLFHTSIRDNLRYARRDATDADVEDACRMARIHDLIASLPDGYDTVVGDRGYRLSGGEKQRVAIARMLLKDPAIVVLDEATSHLDSESEVLIQRALADALQGRTSLVIAHRLSTIVAADRILVVDGGRIVQQGTHEDLLAEGGLYADLYRTQYERRGEGVTPFPAVTGDLDSAAAESA
ncbi:MAG TPA: ABC transporter ATP-binding protein [Acidimicrobiia bacterium]|nr:ABC transporter ATP-binding protein [Acidimicrobiia bacterium]